MTHEVSVVILRVVVLAVLAIIALVMIVAGPPELNHWFGYRTARAMRNQDTWDFAQRAYGPILARCTVVAVGVTAIVWALGWFFTWNESSVTLVIITLQTIALFVSIPLTEAALRAEFDDWGKRHTHPTTPATTYRRR